MTCAEAWESELSRRHAQGGSRITKTTMQQHTEPMVTKRLFCIGKAMKNNTVVGHGLDMQIDANAYHSTVAHRSPNGHCPNKKIKVANF